MKKVLMSYAFLSLIFPVMLSAEEFKKEPNVSFIYSELVIQILGTLFLIWLIKKFAWKNFQESLEKRRTTVNKNINDAQNLNDEAGKLKQESKIELENITSKKKEILSTTITQAKDQEKLIVEKAKIKSRELIEKAKDEAQKEKEQVKVELSKELASVSIDMVKKFMFDELTENQENKLIKQAIKEVKID